MEEIVKKKIVGVRFSPIGKSYYFDASKVEEVKVNDLIVVETSRGWQIGEIVQFIAEGEVKGKTRYKPISRIATANDLEKKKMLEERSEKALAQARSSIKSLKIKGVKIVSAEFSFDEHTISYLYTTDSENNVRFTDVTQQVKDRFHVKKVDFHKIGPRDVAKYYCGMGACGMEVRCCSQFLNKFDSISIRMAKKQGISLTPSDITGMCDRLRCCLNYEYCTYVDALKGMPKRNKIVQTPLGKGKVKDIAPLKKSVIVQIPNHGIKEFPLDEIEIAPADTTFDQAQPTRNNGSGKQAERKPAPKQRGNHKRSKRNRNGK